MVNRSSCERVRYWASLAPDGVLSEFEQRLLDDHVAWCDDCHVFAAGVAEMVETLRAAPPEQPHRVLRFQAPARPRFRLPGRAYLRATVGVAAMMSLAAVVSLRSGADPPVPIRPAIVIDATSVEGQAEQVAFLQQLRDYRNAQNATESNLARERKPGFQAG